MLDCLTWATAHLFGSALAEQHRLRYRVFVERAGWNVPHIHEMEWDKYDTPAAHYLVWRDDEGTARGVVRFSPTTVPYMIADVWPDMIDDGGLPHDDAVWEATRLAVDPALPAEMRREIRAELVVGIMEFGRLHGIRQYLHLMPVTFVRSFLWGNDMDTRPISPVCRIDGIPCRVWMTTVTEERLEMVRAAAGVANVLRLPADVVPETRAA